MSNIQRYVVDAYSKHDWSLEADNFGGDLVKYEDHASIVANLKLSMARQIEQLQSTLKAIQAAIPCHNSESGFVIDHCNENGDYVSTEWVDPTQIVFDIQKILSDSSEAME